MEHLVRQLTTDTDTDTLLSGHFRTNHMRVGPEADPSVQTVYLHGVCKIM